jgi:type IV pilus assembly protein PilZ
MPERESDLVHTTVERRLSPRAPVTVRVDYATVDAMFSEFSRNINEGGLFIETETPLVLEELVQLHFRLPGVEDPFKVSGRVAWVREEGGPDGPPGMGVEFENLDENARRQIDEIVQSLRVDRQRS